MRIIMTQAGLGRFLFLLLLSFSFCAVPSDAGGLLLGKNRVLSDEEEPKPVCFLADSKENADGDTIAEWNLNMKFGGYHVDNWDRAHCKEGCHVMTREECFEAMEAYKARCGGEKGETKNREGEELPEMRLLEVNWAGTPGCHVQFTRGAQPQFQFNRRWSKSGDFCSPNHAPVCKKDMTGCPALAEDQKDCQVPEEYEGGGAGAIFYAIGAVVAFCITCGIIVAVFKGKELPGNSVITPRPAPNATQMTAGGAPPQIMGQSQGFQQSQSFQQGQTFQQNSISVQVPEGVVAGQEIEVPDPRNGQMLRAPVPAGLAPGATFQLALPPLVQSVVPGGGGTTVVGMPVVAAGRPAMGTA